MLCMKNSRAGIHLGTEVLALGRYLKAQIMYNNEILTTHNCEREREFDRECVCTNKPFERFSDVMMTRILTRGMKHGI
jgi:hypothetical protein